MWTFFPVRLHPPHTNILQVMLKDNNSKNYTKKPLEQQQNTKILIRRQPSHYVTLGQANYYLNVFHTILCAFGNLDMRASKYNTDASFILPKTIGPLQFLKESQNHKRTIFWSQILVTNLVNLVIPAIHFTWIPYDHAPVIRSTGVTGYLV